MPIRRKKRMDLVLPTSSMGDIAFLLIIFFILASNFMKTANVEAEKPASESVESVEDAQVSVIVDQAGKYYVQGLEVSKEEIESAVTQAVGDKRDQPVHLLVDKNVARGQFMPAMEALGAAGVKVVLVGDKL
jgi:biopolymer transport protein ExbD